MSVKPLTARTRTFCPTVAPASQRAIHVSPANFTWPVGKQVVITSPDCPISVSLPTCARPRWEYQSKNRIVAISHPNAAANATSFQGCGAGRGREAQGSG